MTNVPIPAREAKRSHLLSILPIVQLIIFSSCSILVPFTSQSRFSCADYFATKILRDLSSEISHALRRWRRCFIIWRIVFLRRRFVIWIIFFTIFFWGVLLLRGLHTFLFFNFSSWTWIFFIVFGIFGLDCRLSFRLLISWLLFATTAITHMSSYCFLL